LSLVLYIGEYPIFMEEYKFHDGAFFDKEEVLALGPGIFEGVGEEFALVVGEELDVLVVKLRLDGGFCRGVVAVIEEEVVVDVFLVDAFPEVFVDFLQVGQGVHVRHLVLLWVVVHLVVVQLVVVLYVTLNIRLALYQ
jgi:hypothetical protein